MDIYFCPTQNKQLQMLIETLELQLQNLGTLELQLQMLIETLDITIIQLTQNTLGTYTILTLY